MPERERILDQFDRALGAEAWHGPGLLEVVDGIDAERAAARPLPAAHTIWEIVLHVASTRRVVLRRLRGEPATPSPGEDWPRVPEATEDAWEATVSALRAQHDELRAAIAGMPEERLDEPILPGFSSFYVTLHGLVQHDLYHAGQIAILRKAAS